MKDNIKTYTNGEKRAAAEKIKEQTGTYKKRQSKMTKHQRKN